MGFEVNPYNPCVANKMINGSKMTVTSYVDDLKISHKESTKVTKFICSLGVQGFRSGSTKVTKFICSLGGFVVTSYLSHEAKCICT